MAEETKQKPEWVKMKPAEVEKIIVDLANQNNSPEKIGLILRDQFGIPKAKVFGKKINQVLKENKVKIKADHERFSEKIENIEDHISSNKHDYTAKKALSKKLWAVSRMQKQA